MPDASEVMEMLLKTQKGENEEMKDDDPQVTKKYININKGYKHGFELKIMANILIRQVMLQISHTLETYMEYQFYSY